MILGLHIMDSRNAGDIASSPLNYFNFGRDQKRADMRAAPQCSPSAVIYGGGSITASPFFLRWDCPTIAWGVGHHVRNAPWHDAMLAEHERSEALCDLYFPRDLVPGFEHSWTPCASCLHSVFDEDIVPRHKVVRYSAARRVSVDNGVDPHMTNEDAEIAHCVRFIGSGEKVITSSYHGAYWARLLGRKVEVVPWGSKFDYVPDLDLSECRERNERAYQRVRDLIGG